MRFGLRVSDHAGFEPRESRRDGTATFLDLSSGRITVCADTKAHHLTNVAVLACDGMMGRNYLRGEPSMFSQIAET